MPLNIKDDETHALARELASRTGTSISGAVKTALQEKLQAMNDQDPRIIEKKIAEMNRIAKACAALPVLDDRTPDEILGYDENGLPG